MSCSDRSLSPRYLIRRDDGRMPSLALQVVWLPLRTDSSGRAAASAPVYYPVPSVLGVNRERAAIFAESGVAGSVADSSCRRVRPRVGRCLQRLASIAAARPTRWRPSGGADKRDT